MTLSLTITMTARSACLRVVGDLDYLTVDEVVDTATQLLAQQVDLANLHLDFDGLTFLDSAALSGLLLICRRTAQAGVRLHLDHRPPILERVLHVTGLFAYFVSPDSSAQAADRTRLGHGISGEAGVR
jgi:anti-anti-sigma factor